MDTWQILSLIAAAFLARLYWLERAKRLQAVSNHDKAVQEMAARKDLDEQTGLLSAEAFDKAIEVLTQRVDQVGSSFAVLTITLDNFRLIQDAYGDEFCSDFLRLVARRLEQSANKGAKFGRTAGGEFAIVIGGDASKAILLAEHIKAALSAPFALPANVVHSTASIGIAVYPEHGAHAKILGCAAVAMRSLKNSGGDGYCVYDPKMATQARDEALLVNELRHAAEAGQFELYFQPKIDARSLQVTAAEALLRWHHPKRGFVSPAIFIPLAEKHGLMGTIGPWVIQEACRTAGEWLQAGLRMRVAVNLSAYQMRQDDLVESMELALRHYGVQPANFTCEITETVAMEDTQATRLTFEKMRKVGLHVSIDDFGTGYSSLGSLRKLPAAELKIDRAFVSDLEESEEARSIAKSIIDMARALNMKVVAEGVETVGQSDILVAMGCDEMQGFLFSMPITARELQGIAKRIHPDEGAGFRDSLFATNFASMPD